MNTRQGPFVNLIGLAILAALTISVTSCDRKAEPAPVHEFPQTVILATDYYTGSPAQAEPPNGQFPAGTRVRVIEDAGSYVRVLTENGVSAFIAADSIASSDP